MLELRDVVKQCGERLDRFRTSRSRLGEQDTKASLISPIIEALGWDPRDPDEVSHEYRRNGTDNPVDYALLLRKTPKFFIEAKGLGQNLDVPKWANQTIAYATAAGVEWVALTDGREWRIYNAHAPVPIEQKLFRAVRIDDTEPAVALLSLFSRDNMRDNRIDELWKEFFVDRQVDTQLSAMFGSADPAAELVAALSQRLPRFTDDEIRASLIRAKATFDFPGLSGRQAPPLGTVEEPAPLPSPAPSPRAAGTSRPTVTSRATRPTVTEQERRVKVSDMIAAGRLRPGSTLHGNYLGVTYRSELLPDGRVRYSGQVCSSLSAAGQAVKVAALGSDAPESKLSTDGLEFWRATDAVSGDVVSVKEIRRRTAQDATRHSGPGGA
ncbi:hypothetical protein EDC02_7602 [Micromonospora sp. Llam0]|uniref:restriction system modified-DNA reader domain-containing protein n=1 Tax=Micromonospora sp. Llam0 TaxID=2485143 RepID=UPI000F477E36|nr:restriction endonuclease [Micromonospora sp. Llam0]ROO52663.1 hypothetical protein EDC02_7602 [Micromonospora sp. Llam0]